MRTRKLTVKAVVLLAIPAALLVGAADVGQDPGVMPPQKPGYAELSARWWQWVSEIPGYENPLFDTTGEFAAVGQPDDVWFLAGTMGGDPVTRECTVPVGKKLFFPVLNAAWVSCPGEEDYPLEDRIADLEWFMGLRCELECTIDGRPVRDLESYRFQSPEFVIMVPEDWIYAPPYSDTCEETHEPGTLLDKTVSDGWWLWLAPLSAGEHEIHLRGALCWEGEPFMTSDVTYNLTVEK